MAGAAPTPVGKGGRKSLDAAINLVPFIDLLSCCISFLLITAAWIQMKNLDVHQRVATKERQLPKAEPQEAAKLLEVQMQRGEYTIIVASKKELPTSELISSLNGSYDQLELQNRMQKYKSLYPGIKEVNLRIANKELYGFIAETTSLLAQAPLNYQVAFQRFPEEEVAHGK